MKQISRIAFLFTILMVAALLILISGYKKNDYKGWFTEKSEKMQKWIIWFILIRNNRKSNSAYSTPSSSDTHSLFHLVRERMTAKTRGLSEWSYRLYWIRQQCIHEEKHISLLLLYHFCSISLSPSISLLHYLLTLVLLLCQRFHSISEHSLPSLITLLLLSVIVCPHNYFFEQKR